VPHSAPCQWWQGNFDSTLCRARGEFGQAAEKKHYEAGKRTSSGQGFTASVAQLLTHPE